VCKKIDVKLSWHTYMLKFINIEILEDQYIKILKNRRRRPEGVNESQSKFLDGTRPISQNQTDIHLF
jgi:hypothetical protein